jgi:hypothetical protein
MKQHVLSFSFLLILGALIPGVKSSIDRIPTTEKKSDWGEWINDDCFKGIDYRVKKGDYNSYSRQWYWYMQIRNRYHDEINISYTISEPGAINEPDHRTSVSAQDISETKVALLNSSVNCHVRVGYLRFGDSDSGSYYSCDQ